MNLEINNNQKIRENHKINNFHKYFDGRIEIKLKHLKNSPLNLDWFIKATVIKKGDVKLSKNKKEYSFFILRDIDEDPLACKTFDYYLYINGKAFKPLYKIQENTLIAVLNPDVTFFGKTRCLSINIPEKLLEMGINLHIGSCLAITPNKTSCLENINILKTKHCVKHLQQKLNSAISQRLELNPMYGSSGRPTITNTLIEKHQKDILQKNYKGPSLDQSNNNLNLEKNDQPNKSLPILVNLHKKDGYLRRSLLDRRKITKPIIGWENNKNKPILGKTFQHSGKRLSEIEFEFDITDLKSANNSLVYRENFTLPVSKSLETSLITKVIKEENAASIASDFKYFELNKTSGPSINNIKENGVRRDFMINYIPKPMSSFKAKSSTITTNQNSSKFKQILQKIDLKPVNPNCTQPHIDLNYTDKIKRKIGKRPGDAKPLNTNVKRKILGTIMDENRLKMIVEAKSKHVDLLKAHQIQEQEDYFQLLENRETVRNNLGEVMELPCTIVSCSVCVYRWWSPSENCVKNHKTSLKYDKGLKRFYQCQNCKKRIQTFLKFPDKSCSNCNTYKYERVPMCKSFDDNILKPEEKLLIRGETQDKFLNSL